MKNKTKIKKQLNKEFLNNDLIKLDISDLSNDELDDLKNSTPTMNLFFNYIKEYHENLDKK